MRLGHISGKLYAVLDILRPKIAGAAQRIYDGWVGEDDSGICDEIAREIGSILAEVGVDTTDGGHDGDDHAYIIAYTDSESYIVDIPYDVYEVGGGYSWQKIPDVVFSPEDVHIVPVDRPDWLDMQEY